ncbi:MAG TPA: phospholipase A [Casimicrobiaceae bacterium]|nr:phospholipase A [Casimicrobiaceae bacterium]
MTTRILQCALLLAAALASLSAFAGDPSTCKGIENDHDRLVCYDAAVGRSPDPPAQARSIIGERWGRYDPPEEYPFLVRLHEPNYIVVRHSDRTNPTPTSPTHGPPDNARNVERDELKFQLSAKARFWGTQDGFYSAWVGYTQQSNWQAFNGAQSRPFRETDYEPELMFVAQPRMALPGGFTWELLNLGLVHQSNGRSDPLSRSWNRAYAQFGVEHGDGAGGKFAILARPWVRIHESAAKDDNPDITDYLGYGDLSLLWTRDQQTLAFTGRLNPRTGKGAAKLEWSMPAVKPFRLYVQVFTGYGESLIDYNFRQTGVGIGFALNDLIDQSAAAGAGCGCAR